MKHINLKLFFVCVVIFGSRFHSVVQAQWFTQQVSLVGGWNPVYLHVDTTYSTISKLVGDLPIEEIWYWNPDTSTSQFSVQSPDLINESSSRWVVWRKAKGDLESELKHLVGNSSYLFYLDKEKVPEPDTVVLSIKGQPKPPRYTYTSSGLNFIGFPVHPSHAGTIEKYFTMHSGDAKAQLDTTFYAYPLDGSSNEAQQVLYPEITPIVRGRAYWVNDGLATDHYVAPFSIDLINPSGLFFGNNQNLQKVRLTNNSQNNLKITVAVIDSEASPDEEEYPTPEDISDFVMMKVDYGPGGTSESDVGAKLFEVVLGPSGTYQSQWDLSIAIDRTKMEGTEETFFAGVLQFSDLMNHSQYNVPITAGMKGMDGVWVGQVKITKVSAMYVKGQTPPPATPVALSYPMRFIMHRKTEDTGKTDIRLFQRVYSGLVPSGLALAGQVAISDRETLPDGQSFIDPHRFSVSHLPFRASNPVLSTLEAGPNHDIAPFKSVYFQVVTAHNDYESNPFLHAFHPDHDNLGADFKTEYQAGQESYSIVRDITFTCVPSMGDFEKVILSGTSQLGIYTETLTIETAIGSDRSIQLQGEFMLQHLPVSHIFID